MATGQTHTTSQLTINKYNNVKNFATWLEWLLKTDDVTENY